MMTIAYIVSPRGIYAREAWAEILKSWRLPQFILPTIVLPVAFYGLFAIAMSDGNAGTATYALATFGVFAAIGPSLFGFGAGIADERAANLIELKRVSPLPGAAYLAAKVTASGVFTGVAVLAIYALGLAAGGVRLGMGQWLALFAIHIGSVVPFALIGLGIGMRMSAKGAIAAANLLFLAFCVLGGLWFPIDQLPGWIGALAWVLPSYHLGELALIATGLPRENGVWLHLACLAGLTLAAGAFALTGWRRSAA